MARKYVMKFTAAGAEMRQLKTNANRKPLKRHTLGLLNFAKPAIRIEGIKLIGAWI